MTRVIGYVVVLLCWVVRCLLGRRHSCTECRGHGWTPRLRCNDTDDSRGPHRQCTEYTGVEVLETLETSLTPEQATVWETVRHLRGVRVRVMPPPPSLALMADQVDRMRFILATFVIIVIGIVLYPFIC